MRLTSTLIYAAIAVIAATLIFLVWRNIVSPSPANRFATVTLGKTHLRFHASYLRHSPLEQDNARIDLVAAASNFRALAQSPQLLPAPGGDVDPDAEQIFLTLTPASGPDPAQRPSVVYGRFLATDIVEAPGGLLRRSFEANSPFAGDDLYLTPPDGVEFSARCPRVMQTASELPNTCLTNIRVEAIDVQIRFPLDLIGDWRHLRDYSTGFVRAAIIH